ncbi:SDR family NAD(P)-dependent oxidoreductase [Catenuloplanes japonicus]|uniref:SDR family NAD(P)-dependent oxidoreductase n=1 Tax=Catenuloplanes japonicus TaxID=33876 RepID=UPI000526A20C|nr:SDR family oxidoreductase [Catenuloplanes japonicus]
MRFDNQTVLVTGGAGGQGASHVRAFHAEGATVVIAGVTGDRGDALAAELGERALAVRLDVSRPDDWTAAVDTATRRFGPITVLVNNAGVQNPPAAIEDTAPEVWERTLGINLTGQFLGIRAVTPSMRAAGGGVIINIGSTMGYGGTALYAPYVAGKWATRGLTRSAALELGRDNIRVNAIHPGVIDTPLITEPAGAGAAPIADFYSPDPFAVPRLGDPADVTTLLLFLASRSAAFATGADFVVDGGLLLGPALR